MTSIVTLKVSENCSLFNVTNDEKGGSLTPLRAFALNAENCTKTEIVYNKESYACSS